VLPLYADFYQNVTFETMVFLNLQTLVKINIKPYVYFNFLFYYPLTYKFRAWNPESLEPLRYACPAYGKERLFAKPASTITARPFVPRTDQRERGAAGEQSPALYLKELEDRGCFYIY
jgi:phosphatidylserine decarboxylase